LTIGGRGDVGIAKPVKVASTNLHHSRAVVDVDLLVCHVDSQLTRGKLTCRWHSPTRIATLGLDNVRHVAPLSALYRAGLQPTM